MELAALYAGAFLLGSVPTAYILGRLVKGIDIRRYGSGNVGGGNVIQHVGKKWFVPQMLSDALVKGAGSIWFSVYVVGLDWNSPQLIGPPLLVLAGNNWSPFLKMQGGRGLGVAAGTLLAFSPAIMGVALLIYFGGYLLTKEAGVWALITLLSLPLMAFFFPAELKMMEETALVWFCLGLLGVVTFKRLTSNWTPLPRELSRKRVFFNRLFRDRDVDDREEWVERIPGAAG
jgi:glycerol-3-phosphate acyltransferase PlsY